MSILTPVALFVYVAVVASDPEDLLLMRFYRQEEVHDQKCTQGAIRAHPDCAQYQVCVRGSYLSRNCPSGTVFNPQINVCDLPSAVEDCGSSRSPRQLYMEPIADSPELELVLDEPTDNVDPIVPVRDPQPLPRIVEPVFDVGEHCNPRFGFVAVRGDCSKFLVCSGGSYLAQPCAGGTRFSGDTQTCVLPAQSQRSDC